MYTTREHKAPTSRTLSPMERISVQQLLVKDNRKNVVQRLITTDKDGVSDFVILASIGAYLQYKGESKVELIDSADYSNDETLYIVAHGDSTEIGGKTPDKMAEILTQKPKGVSTKMNLIFLAACQSGEVIDDGESYAHKLKKEICKCRGIETDTTLRIEGIPGHATITNLDNADEIPVDSDKSREEAAYRINKEARTIYENVIEGKMTDFNNKSIIEKAKFVYGIEEVKSFFKMFTEKQSEFTFSSWNKTEA